MSARSNGSRRPWGRSRDSSRTSPDAGGMIMGDIDPDPDCERERDRIDELAEEFAACCRRGEQPSVAEYAARHPDYAEQIRAILPTVALMEQWKHRRRNPRGAEAAAESAV